MSILIGYAIPTEVTSYLDHTYVWSKKSEADVDPEYTWSCFGSCSEGKNICSGYGNDKIANCIDQVRTPLDPLMEAGIQYGVNGVCHQAANRVLYPARVLVKDAKGYGISSFMYGDYGGCRIWHWTRHGPRYGFVSDPAWPKIIDSCHARLEASCESKTEYNTENTTESLYIQKVLDLYNDLKDLSTNSDHKVLVEKTNDLIIQNFEYLVELLLGDKVDSQINKQIQKQQIDVLAEKNKKVQELYNGDISVEKYVKEVNDLITDNLISFQENLGKNIYEKIFNLPANKERIILIDPDIAKEYLKINLDHK